MLKSIVKTEEFVETNSDNVMVYEKINEFLLEKQISRSRLIDIKYTCVQKDDNDGRDYGRALVIYTEVIDDESPGTT